MKNSLIVLNENKSVLDVDKKIVSKVRDADLDFLSFFSFNANGKENLLSVITSSGSDNFLVFSYKPQSLISLFDGYERIDDDGFFTINVNGKIVIILSCDCEDSLKKAKRKYYERLVSFKNKFVFKFFGNFYELEKTIRDAKEKICPNLEYFIEEKNGDHLVKVFFPENKNCEYDKSVATARQYIYKMLSDKIYAEFDTTLSARVFDFLKAKNKRISTAESFTGGRVINSVISNVGASAYVNEGAVTYSNYAKHNRLGVCAEDLSSVGAVSSEVAFQMAKGLLLDGACDIAVSTTGIAGPNSDDTNKPVGLCYIGVGMRDGIDVYKYNLTGDREEITETAKNIALFLCIKKLKNI